MADNDINFTHENGRKTLKLRLRYTGQVPETMSQVLFEHMQMRFALISRRPCNDYPRVRHRASNRFLKRKKFTRAQARRSNLRRKKKAIHVRQEHGIMFDAKLSMKVREGSVGLPMVPKASLPP